MTALCFDRADYKRICEYGLQRGKYDEKTRAYIFSLLILCPDAITCVAGSCILFYLSLTSILDNTY